MIVYYTWAEDLTGGMSLRWIVGETLFYFICNFTKIFLFNIIWRYIYFEISDDECMNIYIQVYYIILSNKITIMWKI